MTSVEREDEIVFDDEEQTDEEELDSDGDIEQEPNVQLGQWLDQLQLLSDGLTGMQSSAASAATLSTSCRPSAKPMLDSYRFSEANLEESADVDLDALIGELCALESQLNGAVESGGKCSHFRAPARLDVNASAAELTRVPMNARCKSPDTDSAYGETISVLSESTQSSYNRSGGSSIDSTRGSMTTPSPTQLMEVVQAKIRTAKEEMRRENLDEAEVEMRLKNEKIKIALEKMKEASVRKLYVKVFTADGSSKNILIDERWTVSHALRQLAEKFQTPLTRRHAIVEYYPDLFMERAYEDHELLVENILMWVENSPNRLLFVELPTKYDIFNRPEAYLLDHTHSDRHSIFNDDARQQLVEEFFAPSIVQPPEIVGQLFLKQDGKKSWKKYTFVLRGSGLYYFPKGKAKCSRDLVCLMNFETAQVYRAVDWKKKYKAPTGWGFAIKHPRIQVKASKYIKYLCAEDESACQRWMTGLRIAKNGQQLMKNWESAKSIAGEAGLNFSSSSAKCSLESLSTLPRKESDMWSLSESLHRHDSSGCRSPNLACLNSTNAKRLSRTLVAVETPSVNYNDNVVGSSCEEKCSSPLLLPKPFTASDARSVCSGSDFSDRVEQVSLNAFELDSCTGTVRRQGSKNGSVPIIPLSDATKQQQLLFSRIANQSSFTAEGERPLMMTSVHDTDGSVSFETGAEDEVDSDEELPPPPPPLCNLYLGQQNASSPAVSATGRTRRLEQEDCKVINGPSSRSRNMPPPPPPKRSETTKLHCAQNGRAPTLGAPPPSTVTVKQRCRQSTTVAGGAESFQDELQRAMQKRLKKLETAEQ